MELDWQTDPAPRWDADRQRIIGAWPASFPDLCQAQADAVLPGRWWRVRRDGQTIGFGWMDVTWGDAEVWVAVSPERCHEGVGTFVMEQLSTEARRQGIRYMYNAIPQQHPEPDQLKSWLERRSFGLSGDGLYKRVL